MRIAEFSAHRDDGTRYPAVEVCIYDTLKEMREAAKYGHSAYADALGVTRRYILGNVRIMLSMEALSMRVIIHECSHAALALRGAADIKSWTDEEYCHIHDEITCDIIDWIVNDVTDGSLPVDVSLESGEEK